jgi:potassium uptake TrkH family protein
MKLVIRKIQRLAGRIPVIAGLLSVLLFLIDFGFSKQSGVSKIIIDVYELSVVIGLISIPTRYLFYKTRPKLSTIPLDFVLFSFLFVLTGSRELGWQLFSGIPMQGIVWLYIAIFIVFTREFSALKIDFRRTVISPGLLFIFSFLFLVIAGTLLLLMPNATHDGVRVMDALFTSASAVCVTGLVVVDTGSYFTLFGQWIILFLIQAGGIGIMTFASYFSYFFRGAVSYESQLMLKEMTNTEKIAEVFSVLAKIIIITLLIEAAGAISIYYALESSAFTSVSERLFFSVFHAVSGFCNAGFSTLEQGLFSLQFSYLLHVIIAVLIIFGGIGFPIVLNLLKSIRLKIWVLVLRIFRRRRVVYPRVINLNTRIVLTTTLILLLFGTISFFLIEYNNTLSEHTLAGKLITAFFGSVTARTAGFNTVDTALLTTPTTILLLFLMWVGASPGSTGGGIKTSTLAIAVMNVISIARGKSRLEIFNREIPLSTVQRSFAIIFLSILAIFAAVGLLTLTESSMKISDIVFEVVSAFSTVGLSRGITADLSEAGKLIIVLTMFLGRVGMLTFLISVFKKVASENYRYPQESIFIN